MTTQHNSKQNQTNTLKENSRMLFPVLSSNNFDARMYEELNTKIDTIIKRETQKAKDRISKIHSEIED